MLNRLRSQYPAGMAEEQTETLKLDLATLRLKADQMEMLLAKRNDENAQVKDLTEEIKEFVERTQRWAAGAGQEPQPKGGENVEEEKKAETEV